MRKVLGGARKLGARRMRIGRRVAHGFREGRGRRYAGLSGELALVTPDCRAPLGHDEGGAGVGVPTRKGLIERDEAGQLVVTDQGRAALAALLR
jgi:hypothetical protein